MHSQLEEEIFYPALRKVLTGDEVLEKSEAEHEEMRRLIGQVRERSGGEGLYGDASDDARFMASCAS